jgi:hypothetical protein
MNLTEQLEMTEEEVQLVLKERKKAELWRQIEEIRNKYWEIDKRELQVREKAQIE